MTDEAELLHQYGAELDRIGISEEARRYFAVSSSLEGAIEDLQGFPSGLGTDGFFRMVHGVDFATWKRSLEAEIASHDVNGRGDR